MESNQQRERYTLGYADVTMQSLSRRTASREAGFLLPYLRSGMDLLDCGCGPGTITVGMAQVVSPGHVVGIDIEESQIERSRSYAAAQGVDNASFEVGNIYEYRFPDNSFHAALIHGVLSHLQDPLKALKEVHRVLKPCGVIGVRSPMGGDIVEPADPIPLRGLELYERLREHNGSERSIGRRQRGLLLDAGFVRVEASASYDHYGSSERVRVFADRIAVALTTPPMSGQLVALGWVDQDELEKIGASWRSWGENPAAFYARPCGEAVGWKE